MSIKESIVFIEDHGVKARSYKGKIKVLDEWIKEGKHYFKWVVIDSNIDSIKNFLGY